MYKDKRLKRLNNSVTYENGNEKWEIRNQTGNEKWEIRIELWVVKLIYKKWIITGLIDKKSCKKQKKNILKKKLLSIMHKTKKL